MEEERESANPPRFFPGFLPGTLTGSKPTEDTGSCCCLMGLFAEHQEDSKCFVCSNMIASIFITTHEKPSLTNCHVPIILVATLYALLYFILTKTLDPKDSFFLLHIKKH